MGQAGGCPPPTTKHNVPFSGPSAQLSVDAQELTAAPCTEPSSAHLLVGMANSTGSPETCPRPPATSGRGSPEEGEGSENDQTKAVLLLPSGQIFTSQQTNMQRSPLVRKSPLQRIKQNTTGTVSTVKQLWSQGWRQTVGCVSHVSLPRPQSPQL